MRITGSWRRGQKELFLKLHKAISLRVSNKLIYIGRKGFIVLSVEEIHPKERQQPDPRNNPPGDVIAITLFDRIVHEHIEVNLVNDAFGIAWDAIERPIRCPTLRASKWFLTPFRASRPWQVGDRKGPP